MGFTYIAIIIICILIAAGAFAWISLQRANRRADDLSRSEQQLRAELLQKDQAITKAAIESAADKVRIESLTREIAADKEKLANVQEAFRAEFRNLANTIFEEKSTQFKQVNKESLELLLKPFRENISDFKLRVEQIYSTENAQRGELKAEIKNLLEQTNRITAETTNLTRALKGDSKTQGDWGEMILTAMLENSGLKQGEHFTVQENLKGEQGDNLRPDVILRLPGGKHVVIDSKTSLTAFVNYSSCEDEEMRAQHLRSHLQSVRSHIKELSAKEYHKLLDSPDFVVMFIPNEPAFMVALQKDGSLWEEAYANKVIISSPTNLFSILKIVEDLWRREVQTQNTIKIAEAGAGLYDKFAGFAETLLELGKNIENTQKNYGKAMNQLQDGKGSLIARTENLRKLGVKAGKRIPAALARDTEDEDAAQDDGGQTYLK